MKTSLLLSTALATSLLAAPVLAGLPSAAAAAGPAFGATWVVDTAADSVSAYAAGAHGAATPVATITGLFEPTGVAVSSNGTVYVANSGNNSITEYAPGATGAATPTATISGTATGLDAPSSITLAGGDLWVTDPVANVVEAFTAGSSGNELPAESISGPKTKLDHPTAVAVDDSLGGFGQDLGVPGVLVINTPTAGAASVTGYLSGKYGDRAPVTTNTGSTLHPMTSPSAIYSTGFGAFWLADSATNTVSQYFNLPGGVPLPPGTPASGVFTSIKGSNTGLSQPSSVAVDALDNLVVGNAGSHTLSVFGPSASGNAKPLRVTTSVGNDTGTPAGLSIYSSAPGRPTDVKAVLHRSKKVTGSSLSVTWKPPADTGGGVIGYDVETDSIVRSAHGSSGGSSDQVGAVVGDVGVSTRGTSLTIRHLRLGRTYSVSVVAVNAVGDSGAANSAKISLTIPPSAPQAVTATASGRKITVRWKAPKAGGGNPLTSYVAEYATCVPGSTGCAAHSRVVGGGQLRVAIGGLAAKTTYDVRVAARSKDGLGPLSDVVKVTTRS